MENMHTWWSSEETKLPLWAAVYLIFMSKANEPHTNLQVNDELLGGGEGGQLSGRPHADPRHCSARAPPQSQNAMISVDGNQGVGHPLWWRRAAF